MAQYATMGISVPLMTVVRREPARQVRPVIVRERVIAATTVCVTRVRELVSRSRPVRDRAGKMVYFAQSATPVLPAVAKEVEAETVVLGSRSQLASISAAMRARTRDYFDNGSCDPCLAGGPVADAGVDQEVIPDTTVSLDGTGSYTSSGASLTYSWQVVSRPSGSRAQIQNANQANATLLGMYQVITKSV